MKTKALILFGLIFLTLSCTNQGKQDDYDISDLVANFQSLADYGGSVDKPSSISFSFSMSTNLHDLDHNYPHDPALFETTGIRFSWDMDLDFYNSDGRIMDGMGYYFYRFSSEEFQDNQSWADEILLTDCFECTSAELDSAYKQASEIRCFVTCTAEYTFWAVYGQMTREASEEHELIIQ